MSASSRPPTGKGTWRGRIPVRTLAILLMVAGAAGFVYARLMFGDQVFCLFGSTLVTFIGLALVIMARRTAGDTQTSPGQSQQEEPRPLFRPKVPPGLRGIPSRQAPVQMKAPARPPLPSAEPAAPPTESSGSLIPLRPATLLEEVVTVLGEQGTWVEVESERESEGDNRAILRVHAQDGKNYTMLVRESAGEVDTADVRALHAMVSSSGSAGGFLVSSSPFTQRAYDWANARRIRLVREDELREISI